jgi:Mce-associated membrane protein
VTSDRNDDATEATEASDVEIQDADTNEPAAGMVEDGVGDEDPTDEDLTDEHLTDEDTDGVSETHPESGAAPRSSRFAGLLVPLLLAVLLLGSAGLASWLYLNQLRPDRETSTAVANDTIKAATTGAVALLSYAPETMDKDFANAKSHLTGDFLNYYSQFTHDIVTPAVQQKAVKTSATIVQSAVSELKPGSAVVLVFLNQTTTSKENPNGSFTASSVKVGLTDVNGTWLISAFDPV